MSSRLTYRADIDGLRALAVLAVIAFHYAKSQGGGFIGVDVFFVISGYLITGILVKAFATDTYSLSDFYQRRIRRIFPALIPILLLCLVVGWFLFFPEEYQRLGKHVAAGAGFVQNFALWLESGYFDVDAALKPLLHLWSLAVEEQFYIFWPLFLWLALRLRLSLLKAVMAVTLISFAINLWYVWQGEASTAFYLPLARAWELMVGAWLAVAHQRDWQPLARHASAQSILGLLLIIAGIAVIRPEYGFPGAWALLPVLGSALLINAGPDAIINRKVLAWRGSVWVGKVSYPLYLWHWVLLSLAVVVFGRLEPKLLRDGVKIGLLLLSFPLSWLTYRYLEQPIRRHGKGGTAVVLALLVAVLGVAGFVVYKQAGFPQRPLPPGAATYLASIQKTPRLKECFGLQEKDRLAARWNCTLGDTQAEDWIMAFGDSHAMHLIPALDEYGKTHHLRVVFAGYYSCLVLQGLPPGTTVSKKVCRQLGDTVYTYLAQQRPQAVVLSEYWSRHPMGELERALELTLRTLSDADIPVLLVEDSPTQREKYVPSPILRFDASEARLNRKAQSLVEHQRMQRATNDLLESLVGRYPGVRTLNTDAALCADGICPWVMDGKFLYVDQNHLSVAGAMRLYPLLEQALDAVRAVDDQNNKASPQPATPQESGAERTEK